MLLKQQVLVNAAGRIFLAPPVNMDYGVLQGDQAISFEERAGLPTSTIDIEINLAMTGAVLKTNLLDDSTTSFGTTGVPFGASPLALLADGGLIVGSAGGAGNIYRFNSAGLLVETYNSGLGTIGGLVAVPVPEPASIVTAMIGAAGAMLCLRRRVGSRS
jgi:hypothetical protein